MRRLEVIGNLGKDCERKTTPAGKDCVSFSVAASGTKKDDVTWVRVAVFGARAVSLADYLTKGSRVFVRGTVTFSTWEKGVNVDVIADEIELIGGNKSDAAPARREPSKHEEQKRNAYQREPSEYGEDDSIPF